MVGEQHLNKVDVHLQFSGKTFETDTPFPFHLYGIGIKTLMAKLGMAALSIAVQGEATRKRKSRRAIKLERWTSVRRKIYWTNVPTEGNVVEFRSEEIERLQAEVARKLGYKLVDHRLELYAVPLDTTKTRR